MPHRNTTTHPTPAPAGMQPLPPRLGRLPALPYAHAREGVGKSLEPLRFSNAPVSHLDNKSPMEPIQVTTTPTHGGARTGAGRPPGSLDPHTRLDNEIGMTLPCSTPLEFLQSVASHPAISLARRIEAAMVLLRYSR